jgi:hypothetical protein
LLAGEADIIIAAMTRTPARGLRVNFTEPCFEASRAALVRRDRVGREGHSRFDLLGIKGLMVGAKQHTTIENFARELFPKEAVKPYASHTEAVLAALNQGLGGSLEEYQVLAQAAPFSEGVGETGCMCGALMAQGLIRGHIPGGMDRHCIQPPEQTIRQAMTRSKKIYQSPILAM